jgi:enoyl-[acyl-carrier-protein] reductase (NADH)
VYLGCTRFRDPQSYPDLQVHQYGSAGSFLPQEQVFKTLADMTLLKVSPTIADMAKTAAFAASDSARMMTGTVLNSSAGAVID